MKQPQNDDNIIKSKQIQCIIFTHFSQIIGFSRKKFPIAQFCNFPKMARKRPGALWRNKQCHSTSAVFTHAIVFMVKTAQGATKMFTVDAQEQQISNALIRCRTLHTASDQGGLRHVSPP